MLLKQHKLHTLKLSNMVISQATCTRTQCPQCLSSTSRAYMSATYVRMSLFSWVAERLQHT